MQRKNKRRVSTRRVVRSGQSQVVASFGTAKKNELFIIIDSPSVTSAFIYHNCLHFRNTMTMKLILSEWTESADHIMVINDHEGVQPCLWC